MGINAAQASAFYAEPSSRREVWAIKDGGGHPAPHNANGQRSMPFWSLMSRAERIVASVDAYKEFARVSISLDEWRSAWLPGLKADGIFVGLNWSGDRATGYDVSPTDVLDSLSARDST